MQAMIPLTEISRRPTRSSAYGNADPGQAEPGESGLRGGLAMSSAVAWVLVARMCKQHIYIYNTLFTFWYLSYVSK